jgi:hypothetical protein
VWEGGEEGKRVGKKKMGEIKKLKIEMEDRI